MAAASDFVAIVVVSAPPPPKQAPRCVASWVLLCLTVAVLWLSTAANGAGVVARRVLDTDSPVCLALLITVYAGTVLCLALLVVAHFLHAPAGAGSHAGASVKGLKQAATGWDWKRSCQDLGASIRKDPTVLVILVCIVLIIVGLLMQVVPVEECVRVGRALTDLGVLGFSAIYCFIRIPNLALDLWETKVCYSSVVPEAKTTKVDIKGQYEPELPKLKFVDV